MSLDRNRDDGSETYMSRRGLVPPTEHVYRTDAVAPWWLKISTLGLIGSRFGVMQRVLDEQTLAAGQDLEKRGLLGDHPLVGLQFLREQVSSAHGESRISLLGASSYTDFAQGYRTSVVFGWRGPDGAVYISEMPAESVRLVDDESCPIPSVRFDFTPERLMRIGHVPNGSETVDDASRAIYGAGEITRLRFNNPVVYVRIAATSVTITIRDLADMGSYLTRSIPQRTNPSK